jgi:hypothetical protein
VSNNIIPAIIVIPLRDVGLSISNGMVGLSAGLRYSLCVEREPGRLYDSDLTVLADMYDSLQSAVLRLRLKDQYRKIREATLLKLKASILALSDSREFSVELMTTWIADAILKCFPGARVYVGKPFLSRFRFSFPNPLTLSLPSLIWPFPRMSTGCVRQDFESAEVSLFEKMHSSPTRLEVLRGQGCEWELIGRHGQPLTITSTRSGLRDFDRNLLCFNRLFSETRIPRIMIPLSSGDVSLGFLGLDQLEIYLRGVNEKLFEEKEIVAWLGAIGTVTGDVIYLGKERLALKAIESYMFSWNSTEEGIVSQVLSSCNDVLQGCKMLEVHVFIYVYILCTLPVFLRFFSLSPFPSLSLSLSLSPFPSLSNDMIMYRYGPFQSSSRS